MPFKTALRIISIRRTNFYIVETPLIYDSVKLRRRFIVPMGTKTDFASIPRFIQFWMDDDGGFIRDAAVLHDFLYSIRSTLYYPNIDREIADNLLIEAMGDLGASWIKQQAVYWALRGAGWMAYKQENN